MALEAEISGELGWKMWDFSCKITHIKPHHRLVASWTHRLFIWLVVWNIFYFPHILGIIIPTDFHIFQRGWNHQRVMMFVFNLMSGMMISNDESLFPRGLTGLEQPPTILETCWDVSFEVGAFPFQGLFPEEYRPLEQSLFIYRRTIQAHRHNDIRKQILQVI